MNLNYKDEWYLVLFDSRSFVPTVGLNDQTYPDEPRPQSNVKLWSSLITTDEQRRETIVIKIYSLELDKSTVKLIIIHVIVQVYTKHGVSWSHLYYRFKQLFSPIKLPNNCLKRTISLHQHYWVLYCIFMESPNYVLELWRNHLNTK